jgi:hypothetical protein
MAAVGRLAGGYIRHGNTQGYINARLAGKFERIAAADARKRAAHAEKIRNRPKAKTTNGGVQGTQGTPGTQGTQGTQIANGAGTNPGSDVGENAPPDFADHAGIYYDKIVTPNAPLSKVSRNQIFNRKSMEPFKEEERNSSTLENRGHYLREIFISSQVRSLVKGSGDSADQNRKDFLIRVEELRASGELDNPEKQLLALLSPRSTDPARVGGFNDVLLNYQTKFGSDFGVIVETVFSRAVADVNATTTLAGLAPERITNKGFTAAEAAAIQRHFFEGKSPAEQEKIGQLFDRNVEDVSAVTPEGRVQRIAGLYLQVVKEMPLRKNKDKKKYRGILKRVTKTTRSVVAKNRKGETIKATKDELIKQDVESRKRRVVNRAIKEEMSAQEVTKQGDLAPASIPGLEAQIKAEIESKEAQWKSNAQAKYSASSVSIGRGRVWKKRGDSFILHVRQPVYRKDMGGVLADLNDTVPDPTK